FADDPEVVRRRTPHLIERHAGARDRRVADQRVAVPTEDEVVRRVPRAVGDAADDPGRTVVEAEDAEERRLGDDARGRDGGDRCAVVADDAAAFADRPDVRWTDGRRGDPPQRFGYAGVDLAKRRAVVVKEERAAAVEAEPAAREVDVVGRRAAD